MRATSPARLGLIDSRGQERVSPSRQGLLEQTRSEPRRFRDRLRSPEGVTVREWRSIDSRPSGNYRLHRITNIASIHGTWRKNDSGEVSDDRWRRLIVPFPAHQQIPSFPSQERIRRPSMTTRVLIRSNSPLRSENSGHSVITRQASAPRRASAAEAA